MATNMSIGTRNKFPCHNKRMDAPLDPKELPEHLQPLMEWIAEDITTREREELAPTIYEYDVFSSRASDMGQTDLVTHSIDTVTGENHPICLPPRRLPITKQDVEQAKVSKRCWSEESLSHAKAAGPAQLFRLPRKMAPHGFAWITGRSTM